jgi:hypothetical protein
VQQVGTKLMEMAITIKDYTFFLACSAQYGFDVGTIAKERLGGAECLLSMQLEGGRHKSYSH